MLEQSEAVSGKTANWRFPAEWEAQASVLLAWPHADTDWAPWLKEVEQSYVELARAILARAGLLLLVKNKALEARALRLIDRDEARASGKLRTTRYDYDDTWLRDTGPLTLRKDALRKDASNTDALNTDASKKVAADASATFRWLDFSFTGWGGKYGASKDDKIIQHLAGLPEFSAIEHVPISFALEGGAVESDGAGTLLTTWNCLSKRHPDKSRAQIEKILRQNLSVHRVLWLEHGELAGDDTDAHIDTLARFAGTDCIVYQSCDDIHDPHYAPLGAMAAEIAQLKQADGNFYRSIALPWAPTLTASDGRRLAASYANYLVLNGAILMPGYGVESDIAASMQLSLAFPQHEIVVVPARSLIEQNGSLHCVTMQLPEGTLT